MHTHMPTRTHARIHARTFTHAHLQCSACSHSATSLFSHPVPATSAPVTLHSKAPVRFLAAMEIISIFKRLLSASLLQLTSPVCTLPPRQPANSKWNQLPPRSPLFLLLVVSPEGPTLHCLEASWPARPSKLRALEGGASSPEEAQGGWLDCGSLWTRSLVTK